MAIDAKYGRVTVEREPGNPLGGDEPVVLFRARDVTLPELLDQYEETCVYHGSPSGHLAAIRAVRRQVSQWQSEHADLVKVPD